jgi:hypothetical protein
MTSPDRRLLPALGAILIAGLALRAAVIACTGGTSDLWPFSGMK